MLGGRVCTFIYFSCFWDRPDEIIRPSSFITAYGHCLNNNTPKSPAKSSSEKISIQYFALFLGNRITGIVALGVCSFLIDGCNLSSYIIVIIFRNACTYKYSRRLMNVRLSSIIIWGYVLPLCTLLITEGNLG